MMSAEPVVEFSYGVGALLSLAGVGAVIGSASRTASLKAALQSAQVTNTAQAQRIDVLEETNADLRSQVQTLKERVDHLDGVVNEMLKRGVAKPTTPTAPRRRRAEP